MSYIGVQKSGTTVTSWWSWCHFYSMMLINEQSRFKKAIDWCHESITLMKANNRSLFIRRTESESIGSMAGQRGMCRFNWPVSQRSWPAPVACPAVNIWSRHRSNSLDWRNQCALTGVSHSQWSISLPEPKKHFIFYQKKVSICSPKKYEPLRRVENPEKIKNDRPFKNCL